MERFLICIALYSLGFQSLCSSSVQKYEDKGSVAVEQVQRVLKLLDRSDLNEPAEQEARLRALWPFLDKVVQIGITPGGKQSPAYQEAVHRLNVAELISKFAAGELSEPIPTSDGSFVAYTPGRGVTGLTGLTG